MSSVGTVMIPSTGTASMLLGNSFQPQQPSPPNPQSSFPMAMMAGAQAPPQNPMPQRFSMQHAQQQPQLRPPVMRHPPALIQQQPSGGPPGGPNQLQFAPNMMGQQQGGVVRRVASQPNLQPGVSQMGVMNQPGQMQMGINPQANMAGQLRQLQASVPGTQMIRMQPHQQHQHHSQHQQHHHQQPQVHGPDHMSMASRQQGMPPNVNVARTQSAQNQLMASLSGPSHLPHHGSMMQNPSFPNPGMVPQHQQQQPQQHPPIPSPRPQSQPSHMSISHTVGGQQPQRLTTPEGPTMFMNMQQPFTSQTPHHHNPSRLSGQYSFPSASTPPSSAPDGVPPGPPNHGSGGQGLPNFMTGGSRASADFDAPSIGGPAENKFDGVNFTVPPRPPSNSNPSMMTAPLQHRSPHASMSISPRIPSQGSLPRPLSQPQPHPSQHQQQQIPGPPSQPGQPRTPRPGPIQMQPSSGAHGLMPAGGTRLPTGQRSAGVLPPGSTPPGSGLAQADNHANQSMRPPLPPGPGPSSMPASTSSDGAINAPTGNRSAGAQSAPLNSASSLPIGNGQGLMRLLQFSGLLSNESQDKLHLSWWNETIQKYFTPKAVMKFTLWKDNQRNEAKPFEIGVPILPRFFLVTTQSGVKSMNLSLDGARERMYSHGHSVVECVSAVWTYRYTNGYTVTLRGPLTAHVVICTPSIPGSVPAQPQQPGNAPFILKFDDFQFDANFHDKYILCDSIINMNTPKTPRSRNAPTPGSNGSGPSSAQIKEQDETRKWEDSRVVYERASLPGEPVNAFGIPQATMRCLELAESVGQMADLICFSNENNLGPLAALTQFASNIREQHPYLLGHGPSNPSMNGINGMYPNGAMVSGVHYQNTPAPGSANSSAVSLYQPSNSTNPPGAPTPSSSSNSPPKNTPGSATNSPQKQHKTIPQSQSQQQQTASTSTPLSAAQRPTSVVSNVNSAGSVPTPTSGNAGGGGGTASSTSTPALANASLKRKQAPGTESGASPTMANSDAQPPPAKRERANRKKRATGTS